MHVRRLLRKPLPQKRKVAIGGLLMGAVCVVALGGCAPQAFSPHVQPTPTSSAPPTFYPEGAAAENQPYFDFTNFETISAFTDPDGHALVQGLLAAGFTKENMQVTFDRTSIDLEADSLEFSVRMGDSCLIGQWGPSATGYRSMVTPVLGTGACLIGTTREIDW